MSISDHQERWSSLFCRKINSLTEISVCQKETRESNKTTFCLKGETANRVEKTIMGSTITHDLHNDKFYLCLSEIFNILVIEIMKKIIETIRYR